MALSSRTIRSVACGAVIALAGLGAAIVTRAAAAMPRPERVGSVPRLPASSHLLGALPGATKLHITVALAPHDPRALAVYASEVATPGSSLYHAYLTPTEFAARFGARPSAIAAVERSLRAHGLHPQAPTVNGMSIPVTATATGVETAFHTSLRRIALSKRTAIVNASPPLLDAKVAPLVQSVIGLQSLSHPTPLFARRDTRRAGVASVTPHASSHVATGGPQPCSAATAAAPSQSAYTIDQIASAYGFTDLYNTADQGQGQTIALYELEPNDAADIATYQSCYSTNASVKYVPVDGGAGVGAGTGEAALDIETAIGLAPKASFIVYQAPNSNSNGPGAGPYDLFSEIVSEDKAQVISASWGQCESLEGASDAAAEQTLFQEAAIQGQTMVSASGDNGSEDCYVVGQGPTGTQLAVDDPSSQQFVTGVGGTSLTQLGPRPTETAWNDKCLALLLDLTCGPGAGGGGPSSIWSMPTYQSQAAAFLHVPQAGCARPGGSCREVPDVSADGDPDTGYLIYWNGSGSASGPTKWQGIGGTSAAAPTWAAVVALANASAGCHGSPLGFVNPVLYRVASTAYAGAFNDVTVGNNDFTGTNGGKYAAGGGYDMATGLGTPDAASLAQTMCAMALQVSNPGAQSTSVNRHVALHIRANDPGGSGVTYGATFLPAGLAINHSTGVISGTPKRLGINQVTVYATDTQSLSGRASFSWAVGGPPRVSHGSLSGLAQARPTLAFTISSGRDAPGLSSVSIRPPRGLRFSSTRKLTVKSSGKRIGHTAKIAHGALAIKLTKPATGVQVAIGHRSLTASGGLARHPPRTLQFVFKATDAAGARPHSASR